MKALWNVKTIEGGIEVEYTNLLTGVSVSGESEPRSANQLLCHFLENSHCAGELVFCDGQFIGQMLPPETDERSWGDEVPFMFYQNESRA
jgi:hypothetical protein